MTHIRDGLVGGCIIDFPDIDHIIDLFDVQCSLPILLSKDSEEKQLVVIRWGAFLTDPPEESKQLKATILDAASRMPNTYADLSGDATYVDWKIYLQKSTGD